MYLCGDFNINLLNSESHNGTKDFIEMLYSLGLYPLIDRPSRITSNSATLIDNIFTNELQHDHISGLLINDTSDHLPVFSIKKCYLDRNPVKEFIMIRNENKEAIKALGKALGEKNWDEVYATNDTNESFNTFLDYFTKSFNEHCPIRKVKISNKKKYKPWFTNGLQNACKKKNNLYAIFLKTKCKEDEIRYKNYKNKLTRILRNSEKDYYDKLLVEQKNNIKGTWSILNSIIGKKKTSNAYPEIFKHKDKIYKSEKEISNGFNDFFVNVGPDLAKNIVAPDNVDIDKYLNNRTVNSMFLTPITEDEILKIINKIEAKKSTDSSGINMSLIKEIFKFICKPFTDICNKSFLNGVFPDKMKIAKVIPLFKSGENDTFTNYRPVSLLPQFSKILEKLFNNRLEKFLEMNELLVEGQY